MKNLLNIQQEDSLISASQYAYKLIKKAILDNRLKSGTFYNERALAEELSISRTPVHKALSDLEANGLLSIVPRKGILIVEFTFKKIQDLFAFRTPLELAVVKQVAPLIADEYLSSFEDILHTASGMNDPDPAEFSELDRKFHRQLTEFTENQFLIDALNKIWDLTDLAAARFLRSKGRFNEFVDDHRKIFEALKLRDVELSIKRMEQHLNRSEEAILSEFNINSKNHR